MTKYQVKIGKDFEVEAVEVQSVEDVHELSKVASKCADRRMRERLTAATVCAVLIALAIATVIGLYDGSFDEVGYVWGAAALPLGYILKAFFEVPQPP